MAEIKYYKDVVLLFNKTAIYNYIFAHFCYIQYKKNTNREFYNLYRRVKHRGCTFDTILDSLVYLQTPANFQFIAVDLINREVAICFNSSKYTIISNDLLKSKDLLIGMKNTIRSMFYTSYLDRATDEYDFLLFYKNYSKLAEVSKDYNMLLIPVVSFSKEISYRTIRHINERIKNSDFSLYTNKEDQFFPSYTVYSSQDSYLKEECLLTDKCYDYFEL